MVLVLVFPPRRAGDGRGVGQEGQGCFRSERISQPGAWLWSGPNTCWGAWGAFVLHPSARPCLFSTQATHLTLNPEASCMHKVKKIKETHPANQMQDTLVTACLCWRSFGQGPSPGLVVEWGQQLARSPLFTLLPAELFPSPNKTQTQDK